MLPITDPTLDLLILQLRLDTIRRRFLLLIILLPCNTRLEDDVFPYGGGVEGRAGRVAFFVAEFRPGAPLGDFWVDGFADDGGADAARGFHFLAGVVEGVGDAGFGAVFVGGYLWGGEDVGVVWRAGARWSALG